MMAFPPLINVAAGQLVRRDGLMISHTKWICKYSSIKLHIACWVARGSAPTIIVKKYKGGKRSFPPVEYA
jgi:hypothetical protein